MNIELKYKDNKKKLLCKNSIKNIQLNLSKSSEIIGGNDNVDINRVVMFNPTMRNRFVFELGNVTLDEHEEIEDIGDEIKYHTTHSNNNLSNRSDRGMIINNVQENILGVMSQEIKSVNGIQILAKDSLKYIKFNTIIICVIHHQYEIKRNIENLLTTYNLQHISVVDWLNK